MGSGQSISSIWISVSSGASNTGGSLEKSAARRDEVAKKFGLPEGMSAGALLEALRALASYEEYLAAVGREENTTED